VVVAPTLVGALLPALVVVHRIVHERFMSRHLQFLPVVSSQIGSTGLNSFTNAPISKKTGTRKYIHYSTKLPICQVLKVSLFRLKKP
jgi:hypothetical protein